MDSVNSIADSSVIVKHFVSYFSKSCSSINVNAASRLSNKYVDMTSNYTGGHIDDSRKFDDELVENVIQMKKGKAADLDGITVEHLYCYSNGILPSILSKLFNLCMTVGYVPLSFGKT